MATSQKPRVIERIYEQLLDPQTGQLRRSIITNEDISRAIDWANQNHGSTLSKNNPANFIKDIIRGHGASGMWPESLKRLRITARQVTGDGNVFEFVEYASGQDDPFPDRFRYHPGVQRHKVQTISVPLATKALGRDDETYLIQVAVKLGIIETHFALFSPLNVVELYHLQIGIKLRLTEVDAMYAAKHIHPQTGEMNDVIITVEAKRKRQRILVEQILQQVRAAFQETPVDLVVPVALTASGDGIYVAEFKAVSRDQLATFTDLVLETETLYELMPPVPGI